MARPVPADLEDALAASPAAREHFWALPPEQVDEWVDWVERARMPRTRRRRIAEAVRRLGGRRPVAAKTMVSKTMVKTNGAGPVAAPPRDSLALWLLALALLVGIAALVYWFAVRNHHDSAKPGAVVVRATVPQVVGLREQAAQFQLRQQKLAATVVKRAAVKPRGIVVEQNPKAGARVPKGAPVMLFVSNGPPGAKLPNVVGLAVADATKRLRAMKLVPLLKQATSKQAAGTVIAQKPAAGELAKPQTPVVLEVARSKARVAVPDMSGQMLQEALTNLTHARLAATAVQVPSSQSKGTVVGQSPLAGQKIAQGSRVRLNVSAGSGASQTATRQPTTTQPSMSQPTMQPSGTRSSLPPAPPQGSGNDYRGMQLARAVEKLAQGRQQAIVLYVASAKPAGIVVSNGTVGAKMRLAVSAGPKPGTSTDLPDVSGEDAAQAQTDLESAGFSVRTVQWPVSDQSTAGTVVYATPAGGGKAPGGATIVLYVGSTSGG
jgi:beta-lactam-binding protein with PASTA domain